MKNNSHILSKARGSKLTQPSFAISQSTIPFASYYEVYGQIYLPIPKPVFPVGTNLTFCMGQEKENVFVPDGGVPFKIEVDDPDFNPVNDGVSVELFVSGDKLWRGNDASVEVVLISDQLGHPYRYETEQYVIFMGEDEGEGMSLLERLSNISGEQFWRCRLIKDVGGEKVCSAMSETVSFNVNFKIAEALENNEDGYPPDTPVVNERGTWYDGTWYYLPK